MSNMTLIIGNKNYSSWSLRPWLMLKAGSIPFKEIIIPLYESSSKERMLQYSPSGKVPVLIHDDVTVWESLAIAEYLADLYPEKNFWPKDIKARTWARKIASEMHAGFTNLRKNCPMNVRGSFPGEGQNDEVKADIKRITEIWEECRKAYQTKGKFLFGHFTAADAMYAPVVYRFNTYGVKLLGLAKEYFGTILEHPAIKEWTAASKKEPWTIDASEIYK